MQSPLWIKWLAIGMKKFVTQYRWVFLCIISIVTTYAVPENREIKFSPCFQFLTHKNVLVFVIPLHTKFDTLTLYTTTSVKEAAFFFNSLVHITHFQIERPIFSIYTADIFGLSTLQEAKICSEFDYSMSCVTE